MVSRPFVIRHSSFHHSTTPPLHYSRRRPPSLPRLPGCCWSKLRSNVGIARTKLTCRKLRNGRCAGRNRLPIFATCQSTIELAVFYISIKAAAPPGELRRPMKTMSRPRPRPIPFASSIFSDGNPATIVRYSRTRIGRMCVFPPPAGGKWAISGYGRTEYRRT